MAENRRAFVIEVMLHDDRWHGHSEWPPSPFRLFQALVAAAARGARITEEDRQTLQWLEALDAPIIAAPRCIGTGRLMQQFVPNNDLDAVGGDPDQVEKIRAPKRTQPRLLQGPLRFLYVWQFEMADGGVHVPSQRLKAIVPRLYQFGRGIDMAFARAHVLTPEEAEQMLRCHPGSRHEPCGTGQDRLLAVPAPGSLRSLERRFADFRRRLQASDKRVHFRQPPKPLYRMVGYTCPPARQMFDIREAAQLERFAPVMQRRIAAFTKQLRDMAADKLKNAGAEAAHVERYLVGRNASAQDKKRRVRIIPLPSIGHEFAGGAIRRVVVEVPQDCPLNAADVFWAFQGEIYDPASGELTGKVLVQTQDTSMLHHYGVGRPAILWRSITPLALPVRRAGRTGSQRLATEAHAVAAVKTALRHAGVKPHAVRIHVQREPFDRNSHMAPQYEPDRFDPHQLWHAEILFDAPLEGPLLLGNGRYLGLGLMAPVAISSRRDDAWREAFVFALPGQGVPASMGARLLKVARAALMELDAATHERHRACELFSGHPQDDSTPLRKGHHAHIFLAAPADEEGRIRHLYVLPPWLADGSEGAQELKRQHTAHFARVVSRLQVLYAPDLPRLPLQLVQCGEVDPLLGRSTIWRSATPYLPTRFPKSDERRNLEAFIIEDIRRECTRRHLPAGQGATSFILPQQARVLHLEQGPRGGLRAFCELRFAQPVAGPLLLGRGSHHGLGCFMNVQSSD